MQNDPQPLSPSPPLVPNTSGQGITRHMLLVWGTGFVFDVFGLIQRIQVPESGRGGGISCSKSHRHKCGSSLTIGVTQKLVAFALPNN